VTRPAVLALAVALIAALALPPLASAGVPRDFVGITAEDVFAGDQGYRKRNLESQSRLGIGLIRQTFDWSTIERTRGRYDFSYHDEFVASAAAHGITVLPILFRAPAFYSRTRPGGPACAPRSNIPFVAFARALVRRYGPRGTLWKERPGLRKLPLRSWQVWNEPNLAQYWCGRANARQYVAMLRAVGRAIKRVDRRADIVTAGLPPSKLGNAVRIGKYIRQLYSAGAGRHFDSLAINSYAKDHKELGALLRSIRRLMNRRGDRRARIWITELGWGDRGPRHRFIVGSKGQAKRISKSLALIRKQRRRLRLRGVVYYSWRDSRPYPPKYDDMWGLHTGLLKLNGSPKRAFHAFGNLMRGFRS
jgi:polysaccharide biosynthesis protein PslG